MYLAQRHNAVPPMGIEPRVAPNVCSMKQRSAKRKIIYESIQLTGSLFLLSLNPIHFHIAMLLFSITHVKTTNDRINVEENLIIKDRYSHYFVLYF